MKKKISEIIKQLRFNLSANNNILFIGFYKYFYNPEKNSISGFLNQYSKRNKKDLTVIQIGANDGITHDPIHKFIKRDLWNGLLLEPQKYVYEKYLTKLYRKNKGIVAYNAALGEKDGFTYLYKIGFCNSRWATGLASFDISHIKKAFESGYIEKCAKRNNISIPENPYDRIIKEKVEVICPETLISKFNIRKIDLLQIDVEGFDYEVIKIFNIEKLKPNLICFESSHLSEKEFNECQKHLVDKGYGTNTLGANTIAMYKPSKEYSAFFNC